MENVATVPGWTARRERPATDGEGGREHDHLEGQARAARSSPCLPLHRRAEERRRLHVQRAPDLLGRQRRRVAGRRELRHACRAIAATRGRAPRRRLGDRARRSRSSRSCSARVGLRRRRRRARSGRRSHEDRRAGGARCSSPSRLHWCCRRWRGDTPRCSPTQPQASGVLAQPPAQVASPTASASSRASRSSRSPTRSGHQETRGRLRRAPADPRHDLRLDEDLAAGLVSRAGGA